MSSADSDDKLVSLFEEVDNENYLLETGFRKPLPQLVCGDKPAIKAALRDHHTLVKIKPELDQFIDGLKTVGVLAAVRQYPSLMEPFFVNSMKKDINKGV